MLKLVPPRQIIDKLDHGKEKIMGASPFRGGMAVWAPVVAVIHENGEADGLAVIFVDDTVVVCEHAFAEEIVLLSLHLDMHKDNQDVLIFIMDFN